MSGTAPTKIGRYDVLSTLGHGGMGVVYLGNDPLLGRKVAIKTILASNFNTEDQDELLRRLLLEGQRAANLRHNGIVIVYEALQDGDATYIVMEYVAGGKLSDRLKERLDHESAIAILREIAEALDYAHQQGIVHRDIKPDNILLDATGRVRIADFGIAKSLSRHSISVGAVGTPHYMAPEQIQNEDGIDGRADQFSLGVIAYFMLTGKKPFDGKSQASTPFAIQKKIVNEDPPAASKVEKSLPPEVDSVLMTALAKKPKDRYPTCTAFVEDLERAIEDRKTVGPAAGGLPARWLIAAAVVFLALAGGFAAWKLWPTSPVSLPHFKLTADSANGPISDGQHFTAPGPGDLSTTVTADGTIPSSAHPKLALLEDGRVTDQAELPLSGSGMKHTFAMPSTPGEYAVRLDLGGVAVSNLKFVIDPAAPPPASLALEIRIMNNVVADGQKVNKADQEYPKPGFIGPNDITATVKQSSDAPVPPGTPVKLEWMKDGEPVSPPVDLTADNIGKPLVPFAAKPRGPDPGQYTAKLTVDGHETLVNFEIVAGASHAAATPPPPAAKWTMQVYSMDCTLTPNQSFLRDDEKCGGIFRPQDVQVLVQPSAIKSVPARAAVEIQWKKSPSKGEPSHDFGPPVAVESSMYGQKLPAPASVTRGAYSVHLLVDKKDVTHFDFEVK